MHGATMKFKSDVIINTTTTTTTIIIIIKNKRIVSETPNYLPDFTKL